MTIATVDGDQQVLIALRLDGSQIGIPSDDRNMDWIDYQSWLAEGNEPAVWIPEVE